MLSAIEHAWMSRVKPVRSQLVRISKSNEQEGYMTIVKRIAWILIGVVAGAGTAGSLIAARQGQNQPSARLVVLGSSSPLGARTASLIKDTKSDGCWLLVSSHNPLEPLALAPAPQGACAVR